MSTRLQKAIIGATAGGLLGGGTATGLSGKENNKRNTAAGSAVGAITGGLLGARAGQKIQDAEAINKFLKRSNNVFDRMDAKQYKTFADKTRKSFNIAAGGAAGAGIAGGATGIYNRKEQEKKASVANVSAVADLIEQGYFGKEAQYAFEGMTAAVNQYVEEDLSEKTASLQQTDYNIYDENAARLARLDNLLRKI